MAAAQPIATAPAPDASGSELYQQRRRMVRDLEEFRTSGEKKGKGFAEAHAAAEQAVADARRALTDAIAKLASSTESWSAYSTSVERGIALAEAQLIETASPAIDDVLGRLREIANKARTAGGQGGRLMECQRAIAACEAMKLRALTDSELDAALAPHRKFVRSIA
jgi:hypothetical protein